MMLRSQAPTLRWLLHLLLLVLISFANTLTVCFYFSSALSIYLTISKTRKPTLSKSTQNIVSSETSDSSGNSLGQAKWLKSQNLSFPHDSLPRPLV
ncbi:hypothetical protein BJ878DRAFT_485512 [Calycina marina]|uniref:Uncharacterized protein n=1 Tax=Calycina marina TaxID=1763456 RepID=A0A9P7ZC35_9HELO|nr:hypothetical protein BJ878DRAFT_485512 [Calycina marina]